MKPGPPKSNPLGYLGLVYGTLHATNALGFGLVAPFSLNST